MKNKVYYGEYSLEYWIKLILKKDIVLPDYQRYFVWDKEQVKTLINTLKEGFFIPPIIIGACTINGQEKNIIIDGQQRLTSILLAYFNVYPKDNAFKEDIIDFAAISLPKRWTFREFTDNFNSITEIKESLKTDNRYKKLEISLSTEQLSNTYIGFSYIVPEIPDHANSQVQQNYFSTIFRYINRQGTELKELESRRALYFLNSNLANWFEPKLLYKISKTDKKKIKVPFDYIKYISILTEYNKRHTIDKNSKIKIMDCIPNTDKQDLEKYYERYIYTFTNVDFEDKNSALEQFGTFEDLYKKNEHFMLQIEKIQQCIDELEFSKAQLTSVISLDVYFFGLIYYVLFLKRDIDLSKKDKLMNSLARESHVFSQDAYHVKSQNTKTLLGKRIEKSLNIYKHYLKK